MGGAGLCLVFSILLNIVEASDANTITIDPYPIVNYTVNGPIEITCTLQNNSYSVINWYLDNIPVSNTAFTTNVSVNGDQSRLELVGDVGLDKTNVTCSTGGTNHSIKASTKLLIVDKDIEKCYVCSPNVCSIDHADESEFCFKCELRTASLYLSYEFNGPYNSSTREHFDFHLSNLEPEMCVEFTMTGVYKLELFASEYSTDSNPRLAYIFPNVTILPVQISATTPSIAREHAHIILELWHDYFWQGLGVVAGVVVLLFICIAICLAVCVAVACRKRGSPSNDLSQVDQFNIAFTNTASREWHGNTTSSTTVTSSQQVRIQRSSTSQIPMQPVTGQSNAYTRPPSYTPRAQEPTSSRPSAIISARRVSSTSTTIDEPPPDLPPPRLPPRKISNTLPVPPSAIPLPPPPPVDPPLYTQVTDTTTQYDNVDKKSLSIESMYDELEPHGNEDDDGEEYMTMNEADKVRNSTLFTNTGYANIGAMED